MIEQVESLRARLDERREFRVLFAAQKNASFLSFVITLFAKLIYSSFPINQPLSDAEFKAISKQVDSVTEKVLGSRQNIALRRVVDPSVMSGFRVTFGSYEIDMTGATHMQKQIELLMDRIDNIKPYENAV